MSLEASQDITARGKEDEFDDVNQSKSEDPALGDFLYRPVDKTQREVRLIHLLPGSTEDIVRCSIHHVNLDGQPAPLYETISYAWGDAARRTHVEIDGIRVSVPVSSANALRRVRMAERTRVVWIDAVCIDQGNNEERGHQVAIMSEVYGRSTGNLIYLGEDDGTVGEALASIDTLHQAADRGFGGIDNWPRYYFGSHGRGRESLPMSAANSVDVEVDVTATLAFLSRPWFRRLWVFQEVVVAPSNICFCGSYQIPLWNILHICVWIEIRPALRRALYCQTIYMAQAVCHYLQNYSLHARNKKTQGPSLARLWSYQRWFECSDLRDRVFALLGICQFGYERSRIPSELSPDYTRPAEDILRAAAKYFILHNNIRTQPLLSATPAADQGLHLSARPSWMPAWTDDPFENGHSLGVLYPRFFSADQASKNLIITHDNNPDPLLLDMRGFVVGHVSRMLDYIEDVSVAGMRRWLTTAERIASDRRTRTDAQQILARTLVAGVRSFDEGRISGGHAAAGLAHVIKYLDDAQGLPPEVIDVGSSRLKASPAASYFNYMRTTLTGRQLIKTDSGHLGVAYWSTQMSDVVVILYGCRMPLIIRPSGQNYKVIGACYIDGIMDGEAVARHRALGDPDKVFTLE